MAFKYTVVIVCAIAISCNGQSYDQENYSRGRLSNFPANQGKTQTIYYPGSAGSPPQYEASPQYDSSEQYDELEPPVYSPMLPVPVPTTTTTTTTTPYPVIVETRRPHSRRPVAPIAPATPITPNAAVRAPARRRRPQSNVVASRLDSRFESRLEDSVEVTEPSIEDEEARLYREEQARNAHYSFGSSIDDTINDHSIHRQETRNGLALKGMYSYSDGFYKRTIHYEADENGYRVVKEEIEPIGEGPQYNPDGRADVATSLHGSQMKYSITADDFVRGRDTPATTPKKADHHRFSQRVRQ